MITDSEYEYDTAFTFSDYKEDILISSAKQLINFNGTAQQNKSVSIVSDFSPKHPRVEFIKRIAFSLFRLGCMYGVIFIGNQAVKKIHSISDLSVLEGSILALTSAATLTVGKLLTKENPASSSVNALAIFSGALTSTRRYSKNPLVTIGKIATMTLTSSLLKYAAFKRLNYPQARYLNDIVTLSTLMVGVYAATEVYTAFSSMKSVKVTDPPPSFINFFFISSILAPIGLVFTGLCLKAFDCLMRDALKLSMPKMKIKMNH